MAGKNVATFLFNNFTGNTQDHSYGSERFSLPKGTGLIVEHDIDLRARRFTLTAYDKNHQAASVSHKFDEDLLEHIGYGVLVKALLRQHMDAFPGVITYSPYNRPEVRPALYPDTLTIYYAKPSFAGPGLFDVIKQVVTRTSVTEDLEITGIKDPVAEINKLNKPEEKSSAAAPSGAVTEKPEPYFFEEYPARLGRSTGMELPSVPNPLALPIAWEDKIRDRWEQWERARNNKGRLTL